MEPPQYLPMSGQPGSNQCCLECPYLAASLHSVGRSASTLLLVVIVEWWSGHPLAPVTGDRNAMHACA